MIFSLSARSVSAPLPRWLLWALWSLLTAGFIGFIIFAAGVYAAHWRGNKTERVSRYVPLPVATVGWRMIGLRSFLDQLTTLNHYSNYVHRTNPQLFPARSESDNLQAALTKLIRDAGAEQTALRLGVTVRPADVDQAYQAQLLQNGNQAQVAATIRQLYQWTPEEFKRNVIRPVVVNDKLQEKLSFDPILNQASRQQAERVLAIVKRGDQSFADLAKAYSEDVYGASGGDVGFIGRGEQAKEIDDAAFNLPVGTVSDLIHTKYGFHILKVTEKKTVDGNDQVRLSQITMAAPSVDRHVTSELRRLGVMVLWRGLRWDAQQGRVVTG